MPGVAQTYRPHREYHGDGESSETGLSDWKCLSTDSFIADHIFEILGMNSSCKNAGAAAYGEDGNVIQRGSISGFGR